MALGREPQAVCSANVKSELGVRLALEPADLVSPLRKLLQVWSAEIATSNYHEYFQ